MNNNRLSPQGLVVIPKPVLWGGLVRTPDLRKLQNRHPQGSAKDTTSSEKGQAALQSCVAKSAGKNASQQLSVLACHSEEIGFSSLFLHEQVNSHPLFMCLKSQHFQCVFGVKNDHPTIGTVKLFLR